MLHETQPKHNLVVCFDGTNKSNTSKNLSNVGIFHKILDVSDEEVQRVLYKNGCAMDMALQSDNFLFKRPKWLEQKFYAMTGWDLRHIIISALMELAENYTFGKTKIFIFGYSRGAYAAHVMAGMLTQFGVPRPHNSALVSELYDHYELHQQPNLAPCLIHPVEKIEFVGVWDTVRAIAFASSPHPCTKENPNINLFRHALALDERRYKFTPSLYTTNQSPSEMWFVGAHSDVGGRWPVNENCQNIVAYNNNQPGNLSRITLSWMIEECQTHVKFIDSVNMGGNNRAAQDHIDMQAEIHDKLIKHSLGGCFWRALEFFSFNFGQPRRVTSSPTLHSTVINRQGYVPTLLVNGKRMDVRTN